MTLIKCRECGNDISNKAKSCIKCGHPNKKVNSLIFASITVCITLVLTYFLFILNNGIINSYNIIVSDINNQKNVKRLSGVYTIKDYDEDLLTLKSNSITLNSKNIIFEELDNKNPFFESYDNSKINIAKLENKYYIFLIYNNVKSLDFISFKNEKIANNVCFVFEGNDLYQQDCPNIGVS